MMGLGDPSSSDPVVKRPDYETATPLFIEMKIATEYLGGAHSEFLNLSLEDRMKLILYDEMKAKAEDYHRKKSKDKQKQDEYNRKSKNRSRS